MIELDVKEYCHTCPAFEAEVDGPQKLFARNEIILTNTIVHCARRNLCAGLMRHLEKEMQKGEKE